MPLRSRQLAVRLHSPSLVIHEPIENPGVSISLLGADQQNYQIPKYEANSNLKFLQFFYFYK